MPRIHKMPFILCLAALCLFRGIQGGRSVSHMGDVTIDISDDKFICDKIVCPEGTSLCVVTKQKESEKSTVLVRTDTCYSATKKVLKESVTHETVDANSIINVHIEGTRNGRISMGDSYSSDDFDSEKFNKEMAEFETKLQKNMAKLNNRLNKMKQQLSHMFDSW